jgi:SAM-dependent methyltransferase
MNTALNVYSHRWFEFFHFGIGGARTMQETAFICRCAPLPHFRRVLDVCCGMGRHARLLSNYGYAVIGIDRDADVIAKGRALAGGPTYMNADVCDYRPDPDAFDVAIIMSQSFGYFDAATNKELLGRLADGVSEGGRVILDLWNQEFFVANQGERDLAGNGGVVRETKHVERDRLFVHLDYPDGGEESFEWQLFSPAQMISMAQSVGLRQLVVCTEFDETASPSPTDPRVQFLFDRGRTSPTNNSPL